jgi:hypothetical protein
LVIDANLPRLYKVVQVMVDKIQNSGYDDIIIIIIIIIRSTYTKGGCPVIGPAL